MITKLPDIVPADLEGALTELGIEYKVRGDEATALCPSPQHFDSSPSWSINLDTGKHHCFSCGFGGSFQWLAQIVMGVRAAEATAWIKTRKIRVGIAQEEEFVNPNAIVRESDLYLYTAPPQWALDSRGLTAQACEEAEVLFDEERALWVCPLRDPWTDRLIGWQTKGALESNRHVVDNYPPKMKKATTVFGYRHLKATGDTASIVMIENPVKVPKLVAGGFRSGAFCGASFVDSQVNDLLWPLTDEVILALDNDIAGHRRVAKFIAQNPYARSSTRVFNYGTVKKINGAYVHEADDRDPGDLRMSEIIWGVEHATPAAFTYFKGIDWT